MGSERRFPPEKPAYTSINEKPTVNSSQENRFRKLEQILGKEINKPW